MESPREIRLADLQFELFLDSAQIDREIQRMADEISRTYAGKTLDVLCILKGSFFFAADLIRKISLPSRIHFWQISSYEGMQGAEPNFVFGSSGSDLKGKDVLIVEDIIDSGRSADFLLRKLKEDKPSSVKFASLLLKPDALKVDIRPDFVGFRIPNHFVVGYGLDYREEGRHLSSIYSLKPH